VAGSSWRSDAPSAAVPMQGAMRGKNTVASWSVRSPEVGLDGGMPGSRMPDLAGRESAVWNALSNSG
jgi:hypothetical protein